MNYKIVIIVAYIYNLEILKTLKTQRKIKRLESTTCTLHKSTFIIR